MAEYRELPRIFGLAGRAFERLGPREFKASIPPAYTLGKGHVRFFYDKCGYLLYRQVALIDEMKKRGYLPLFADPYTLITGLPVEVMNSYQPTEEAIALNLYRLRERDSYYDNEDSPA